MKYLNETSSKLYEDIRFIAFRLEHLKADLNNDFKPTSNLESKVKGKIEEYLNNIQAEVIVSLNLLNELTTVNSDEDLELLIDANEEFSEETIN